MLNGRARAVTNGGRTQEGILQQLFVQHGAVHSVSIVEDRMTGCSRGFGFIEMDSGPADAAISALAGTEMDGRTLNINEARPRTDRMGGGQRHAGGGRDRW